MFDNFFMIANGKAKSNEVIYRISLSLIKGLNKRFRVSSNSLNDISYTLPMPLAYNREDNKCTHVHTQYTTRGRTNMSSHFQILLLYQVLFSGPVPTNPPDI